MAAIDTPSPVYDTIVVGAGAAGAPLAARLSEDAGHAVLLLEAGPDYEKSQFPEGLKEFWNVQGAVPGHPNNWAFLGNLTNALSYSVARGKIIGGSTALNAACYVWGRKEDFDRYVALGNDEWSFAKVLPSYRRIERDSTYGETAMHGGSGPVPVCRVEGDLHPLSEAFNAACAELGFKFEPDKNSQATPGYGPSPLNVADGVRMNTGFTFIDPIRKRPNFTVQGDTYVRRVVFEGKKAIGVEVERSGRIHTLRAHEIVLSCGAVKSPHVLMLSGVGPREQLERAGIEVLVDSPVGKEFSDHPDINVNYRARRGMGWPTQCAGIETMLNFSATDAPFAGGDLEIAPTTVPFGLLLLGHRIGEPRELLKHLRNPSGTLRSLKGVSFRRVAEQVRHRNDYTLMAALQQPVGRGCISIGSSDPNVQPRIDYHYLEHDDDLRRMREAVRKAVDILRTDAYSPFAKDLTELTPSLLKSDQRLDEWMRAHLATAIHASGSCRMGPADDRGAVVDQYGRVRGVEQLRVADTSILPTVVSRGTAPTAMMIGVRVADFMMQQRHELERADPDGGQRTHGPSWSAVDGPVA